MARDLSALTRVHTLLDQLVVEQAPAPTTQTTGNPSETISQYPPEACPSLSIRISTHSPLPPQSSH
jgi:hypothetical protein